MGRWAPASEDNCYAVAIYEYEGIEDKNHCIPLELGEGVFIYEECDSWYRGCTTRNQNITGIFPKCYVRLKPAFREIRGNQISIVPKEDPITEEAKNILREWHDLWKDLFANPYKDSHYKQNIDLFCEIKTIMSDMIQCLCSNYLGVLGQNQLEEKKRKITQLIDKGNALLGLDLVPRDEFGNKVSPITCSNRTPEQKGVLELYNIHKSVKPHNISKATESSESNESVHLFFGICQCVLLNQTPLEVYATLYHYERNEMISERFLVPLTRYGLPENRERLNDISTVFTDISRKELEKLYIIIRYYRRGPLKFDANTRDNNRHTAEYLRPLGLSYIAIKNHIDTLEASTGIRSDKNINRLDIYTLNKDKGEYNFSELHRKVIMGERAQFQHLDHNQGLHIPNLKIFSGPLAQVQAQNPHIFKKAHVSPSNIITRKLGFPSVINPTDRRNDLYVTLKTAKFSKGNKKAEKNVLVNVYVRDGNGKTIPGCISKGTGEPKVDEYQSSVIYHCNSPVWDETIRVNLPENSPYTFDNCHILFTFRHVTNNDKNRDKPGFSFLKLSNKDGTLIANKDHQLVVYKDSIKTADFRHKASDYLKLESFYDRSNAQKDVEISKNIIQKHSEQLTISTVLCSSEFTQNSDLKSLLQWKEHEPQLGKILAQVPMIQGEELVKFLHHIFEALFMILDEKDTEYGDLVFDCLVYIIYTLADDKFEHFRPVLDNYIITYFFHAQVYIKLLDRLKNKVKNHETDRNIGDSMKALEYLFKFIVQSSNLHRQSQSSTQTIDRGFKRFVNSLCDFFGELNNMIKSHQNCLNTAKALKYFPQTIPELNKILPITTTCGIISDFIDAVPSTDEKEIIGYKLRCIGDIVKGVLLDSIEGCTQLIPLLMKHLKLHLKHDETARDELEVKKEKTQAVNILTYILITVSNKHSNTPVVKMIVDDLMDILFRLVCQVDKEKDMDLARDYVSCLIALLHLMNNDHYTSYMKPMNEHNLIHFLNEVFLVFNDLMKSNVYPRDWIVMNMLQSYVVLNAIICFSKALTKLLPQVKDYMGKKKQLWENFFYLCVAFITQDTLQLEDFRQPKRKKISSQYGDMRSEMGLEMISMWKQLGDSKRLFVPEMVGPFLEVTLVPLDSLRREVIPIFFDMIECYHYHFTNFDIVEREVIDKLDVHVSQGKGDKRYVAMMYEILLKKCNNPDLPRALHQSGVRFVNSVKYLLEHLLNFREVRESDHHSEAKMLCIVNLLNFYEELNRQEMYLRYIWKLYSSHLLQKNFVEAAFTLEMYASKLKFESDMVLEQFEEFPREKDRERKARLFKTIINHHEEGMSFENCFPFYKLLADYYETIFDYKELSGILTRQAAAYTNILKAERQGVDFFYIGFYGLGFPQFLQNRRFIYCGRKFEKAGTVNSRFQEQFPAATLLPYTSHPDEEIKNSPKQHLQIYKVNPVIEEREEFIDRDVPSIILQFYDSNDVKAFSYDKIFNKSGGKAKDDDFGSLWIHKTTFFTMDPLPSKLRLAEITHHEISEISPIKSAIETMETKNKHLRLQIDGYKSKRETSAKPLSMTLQGTIDARVMGGIKKYEDAFFNEGFISESQQNGEDVLTLKRTIIEQVEILQEGVEIHGKVCDPSVKQLHEHIVKMFNEMRKDTSKYRRELGLTSGTPSRASRASFAISSSSSNRYNSTLSRNMRSRHSMVSVTSAEETAHNGSTPPPLPSRKEILPDPVQLIQNRRSIQTDGPDQPVLPPKKRSSIVHGSPLINGSPLGRDSARSINSNSSADNIDNSSNSLDESQPPLPPRPANMNKSSPESNSFITDDSLSDTQISGINGPPPLPQRTNSNAARPPKVPRDKSVPVPSQ